MDDASSYQEWLTLQSPPKFEQMVELRRDLDAVIEAGEPITKTTGLKSIKEAAYKYGIQTGLAWRYEKLVKLTEQQEGNLDIIASFAPFVIDEHMLLPSVTQTRKRFDLDKSATQLKSIQVQYIIDQPPRAITTAPTWRAYIWRQFPYPKTPHPKLLPSNETEIKVWKKAIKEGWIDGLEQAQENWENNLNKLVRDIKGRITYRILEKRGVVQRPVMVAGIPRVTRSKDNKTLNAGESIYSIAISTNFKSAHEWSPLLILPHSKDEPRFYPTDKTAVIQREERVNTSE